MSVHSTGLDAERGRGMPFANRVTASIDDCVEATGISRSALYNLMRAGEVEFRMMGTHRIVVVASLLKVLNLHAEKEDISKQQPPRRPRGRPRKQPATQTAA